MPGKQIHLFVKGKTGKTHDVHVEKDCGIETLYNETAKTTGIPVDQIRLIFEEQELTTRDLHRKVLTLSDYGIDDQATIEMWLRLRGD